MSCSNKSCIPDSKTVTFEGYVLRDPRTGKLCVNNVTLDQTFGGVCGWEKVYVTYNNGTCSVSTTPPLQYP